MKIVTMGTRALSLLAGGLFLALAFAVAPVQAQQPAPQPQPDQQQQQQDVPELEGETLESFAEAYIEIGDVRTEMQSELEGVQDQSEANEIQQDANEQMQTILEEHDLTVEDYQQITQVLNQDPEQRQEFEALVQELQEDQDAG
ncbi:MAG: DUF4168 domain-containing protein [Gemmatimonadota bacterium]